MQRFRSGIGLALLGLLPLVCAGCFGTSREFKEVRGDILRSLDAEVEESVSIGLGRATLRLARGVLSFVPDEDDEDIEMARGILRLVRRVEVAVYELEDAEDANHFEVLREIDPTMVKAGLEPIVRHVEHGEMVTVYIEAEDERVKQLFVVVVDSSELVMVRVHGKLEEAVTLALEYGDVDILDI